MGSAYAQEPNLVNDCPAAIDLDTTSSRRQADPMKITLFIVGGVLILVGLVWALQGFGILPGSVMSGHMRWVLIGGAMALVGVVLGVLAARMKK